jgi:hypothetical protein
MKIACGYAGVTRRGGLVTNRPAFGLFWGQEDLLKEGGRRFEFLDGKLRKGGSFGSGASHDASVTQLTNRCKTPPSHDAEAHRRHATPTAAPRTLPQYEAHSIAEQVFGSRFGSAFSLVPALVHGAALIRTSVLSEVVSCCTDLSACPVALTGLPRSHIALEVRQHEEWEK